MALFSRSGRNFEFYQKTPTDNVGPGSYELSPPRKPVKRSAVPFTSSADRFTTAEEEEALDTPGPGTYDNPISALDIRSSKGATFSGKGKTVRVYIDPDIPGPGAYQVKVNSFTKSGVSMSGGSRSSSKKGGVKWVREVGPPSIPAPHQSHGYVDTPQGKLRQNEAPQPDQLVAEYDARSPTARQLVEERRYRATSAPSFARGSARSAKEVKEKAFIPGPGRYNFGSTLKAGKEGSGLSSAFNSKSKRTEMKKVEDVPGPGTYDLPATLKVATAPSKNLQFFGTSSQRFPQQSVLKSPGPGAYDLNKYSAIKAKPKSATSSPFNVSSSRFIKENPENASPGPGSYSFPSSIKAQTRSPMAQTLSAFSGSAARFDRPAEKQHDSPGPGSYNPPAGATAVDAGAGRQVVHRGLSSSFASGTKRSSIPSGATETPPPGAYELVTKPKQLSVSVGNFGSTSPRFRSQVSEVPGPGAYSFNSTLKLSPARGSMYSSAPRFINKKPAVETPGPGIYNLSGSLHRHSFNVTAEGQE